MNPIGEDNPYLIIYILISDSYALITFPGRVAGSSELKKSGHLVFCRFFGIGGLKFVTTLVGNL